MENTQTKWDPVEPQIWKPVNEGDSIEGVLVNKKTDVGVNDSNAYYIENKEGTFMVWGTTVLDDRMSVVEVGNLVKIEFKGTAPTKFGKDAKIFKVFRAKTQSEPQITEETV